MSPPTLLACGCLAVHLAAQPVADHHQHLLRLSAAPPKGYALTADELIRQMDEVGIRRGVVLSVAYMFGNPFRPPVENEYERVKAENDWTAAEVAKYGDRLVAFCGLNPLKDYAVREIARCAQDPRLRRGIKLHFGNSDVDMDKPEHVAQLRRVFAEANRHRMAVVAHIRSNLDHGRPWGEQQARIFLEQVLPAAPDIVVLIAHMASSGAYDRDGGAEAMNVFASAVAAKDPRVKRLLFDLSGIRWQSKREVLVKQLRTTGTKRLLYGSDAPLQQGWEAFQQLPLSERELRQIQKNVAPYLR